MRRGRDLMASPRRETAPVPAVPLEGRLIETAVGTCFLVEYRYPLSYRHGYATLGAFLEEPVAPWAALAMRREPPPLDPAGLVFLDIETTGLSDGAGIYAFLIGLGRFEGDAFHLYQFFMRSPVEERALLLAVADVLKEGQGLVTFNGRGFDLPVLHTRYTMARVPLPWKGQAHLDLLHPARRAWRARLASCSLSSLEEHLLGVERSLLDIPGWRIPSVYRDYVCGVDASVLEPIFYHNVQDILSMVTLATRLARLLRDPWGEGGARHGLEFCALGRLYEQQGEVEQAIAAYRAALLLAMPAQARERTWKQLALLLKRRGDWEGAVEIWDALVQRPGRHPLYAFVELAKYYEHRRRDLCRAEELTRRAIAEHGEEAAGEDLAHRLERLRRKSRRHDESREERQ